MFNPNKNPMEALGAEMPVETAEGQPELSHEEVMNLMRAGYEGASDERLEEMLADLRAGALEALKEVDLAKTDAALRRRNINAWYKEWEKEEAA